MAVVRMEQFVVVIRVVKMGQFRVVITVVKMGHFFKHSATD